MNETQLKINELSDDCLRLVLNKSVKLTCHTSDTTSSSTALVQLASICNRWLDVVRDITRARQKNLKLFDNFANVELYRALLFEYGLYVNEAMPLSAGLNDDHVFLRQLCSRPVDCFQYILETIFGNEVKNLVIYSLTIDHLAVLSYWTSLSSLTLVEIPDSRKIQDRIWRLLDQSMSNLKALHLLNMTVCDGSTLLNSTLGFLSRLEQFTLDNYRYDPFDVLNLLSPVCTHLRVGPLHIIAIETLLEKLITIKPELVASLTYLSLRTDGKFTRFNGSQNVLRLIGENFTQLTYLDCEFMSEVMRPFQLNTFIQALVQLPNLTDIRTGFSVNLFHRMQNLHAPLPMIRTLHIVNSINNNLFLSSVLNNLVQFPNRGPQLAVFPNLEKVKVVTSHSNYRYLAFARNSSYMTQLITTLRTKLPAAVLRDGIELIDSEKDFVPKHCQLEPLEELPDDDEPPVQFIQIQDQPAAINIDN